MPPIVLKIIADTDSRPACHSNGTSPPMVEPIVAPIQIIAFMHGLSDDRRAMSTVDHGVRPTGRPQAGWPAPAARFRSTGVVFCARRPERAPFQGGPRAGARPNRSSAYRIRTTLV